ncbi:hypothetical protein [Profundibacterium mesophilum]|uniref:Uncharacterized protein n=1 Tax=Profundibacterium mesophilum KAUST100406-0324 TaxID=1037889 RepID=A0A921NX14_9RHOB|nr:hypothetical protein [Profundibacterium mesophilum]KAF0675098.1 hypothetical protein PMES_02619 [Profundibacterium mesophilum KAUST100406-0324]
MTENGRAFVIARLSDCPDLAALRRVWESLSAEYQRDGVVRAAKDALKTGMEGA